MVLNLQLKKLKNWQDWSQINQDMLLIAVMGWELVMWFLALFYPVM